MSDDQTPAQPPLPAEDERTPADELNEQDRKEREERMRERGDPQAPDRDDPTTADAGTSEAPS